MPDAVITVTITLKTTSSPRFYKAQVEKAVRSELSWLFSRTGDTLAVDLVASEKACQREDAEDA